jgi:hypothetical protein
MRFLLVLFAGLSMAQGLAQEEPTTIRVKKESNLSKAVLDNTENRLFVVDRFGNPTKNEIIEYMLTVKSARDTRSFRGYSNSLTPEMVKYLNRQKSAVKIFFTSISAKDDNDHAVKLPDVIETWVPECGNCEGVSRQNRRRK